MMFLQGRGISDLYPQLLEAVLEEGQEVAPRGLRTIEVTPLAFELEDPGECLVRQKARRLNCAYAIIERLSLVSGVADPDMLCFYVDNLRDYVNPCTCAFDGAYGPRVQPQLEFLYRELRRDPDSRRAVISIYSAKDHRDSLDVPCTLTLQFLVRNGRLDLIVNLRSSDLFLGLPYDVSQFCFLQQIVAGWLNLSAGRYIHWSGSAHLYADHLEQAKEVVGRGNDLVERDFGVPRLGYHETFDQVAQMLEMERDLREGGLAEDRLPADERFVSLAEPFREYVRLLARYILHKTTRVEA